TWLEEYESYAWLSEDMRAAFGSLHRRIPILHRNGSDYLLSPATERMERVPASQFRRFGPYRLSSC
ncbi:MAG TPA: hypothetical protein PKN11_05005, partial [Anaerolineaceae bacterium]|nr:hypothetical protein [Anaerolineaceae bacterium]